MCIVLKITQDLITILHAYNFHTTMCMNKLSFSNDENNTQIKLLKIYTCVLISKMSLDSNIGKSCF